MLFNRDSVDLVEHVLIIVRENTFTVMFGTVGLCVGMLLDKYFEGGNE